MRFMRRLKPAPSLRHTAELGFSQETGRPVRNWSILLRLVFLIYVRLVQLQAGEVPEASGLLPEAHYCTLLDTSSTDLTRCCPPSLGGIRQRSSGGTCSSLEIQFTPRQMVEPI